MLARLLGVAAIGIFGAINACQADECNPADFAHLTNYTEDIRVNILYAEALHQKKQLDGSHSATGDFIGWAAFTDAGQLHYLDELNQQFNLAYSSSDQRTLLDYGLDATGEKGYEACLNNLQKSIYLRPIDKTPPKSDFSVEMRLVNFPSGGAIPIQLKIQNGSFGNFPGILKLSKDKKTLTANIQGGGKFAISIHRNISLPFSLTATALTKRPDYDVLSLPAEPTVIVTETRYSTDVYTPGCFQCSSGSTKTLCVKVPNDEIIVGGSERLEGFQQGNSDGMVATLQTGSLHPQNDAQRTKYTAKYDPHLTCVNTGVSVGAVRGDTNWCGISYLTATVMVAVPRGQSSSGRVSNPPRQLTCQLHP